MRPLLLLSSLVVLAAGCSEELSTPADCPALCPGGQVVVLDTVLTPDALQDSTFVGYTGRGLGLSFNATTDGTGLPLAHGVLRFFPRPDSLLVNDTLRGYTIDSVAVSLTVAARDTNVANLRVLLYRIPDAHTLDTTVTFDRVALALDPANLVDSLPVADTAYFETLRRVYAGADLDRLAIPPSDSGVLGLAVVVHADGPAVVRFPSVGTGGPTVTTYVTADVADEEAQAQQVFRTPTLATWVQATEMAPDPDLLTVGGTPSARSLVRFTLPPLIRDSGQVAKAVLELDLMAPLLGVPGDSVTIEARPVLVDLSAKSPTGPASGAAVRVAAGTAGTLRLDVTTQVRGWLGENGFPEAFVLYLIPEASTFTTAQFGSTRLGSPPRVHLTYALPFDFGSR